MVRKGETMNRRNILKLVAASPLTLFQLPHEPAEDEDDEHLLEQGKRIWQEILKDIRPKLSKQMYFKNTDEANLNTAEIFCVYHQGITLAIPHDLCPFFLNYAHPLIESALNRIAPNWTISYTTDLNYEFNGWNAYKSIDFDKMK